MERQQEFYTRQYGTCNKHEQLRGHKLIQVSGYGTAEGERLQKLGIYGWKTGRGGTKLETKGDTMGGKKGDTKAD